MAITAVSGVKLTDNWYNTTFTGKKKTRKNAGYPQHSNIGSNALKSVPIIVMLTMTPAELSSGTQPQYAMPVGNLTEIPVQVPLKDVSTVDLRTIQAPEEVDYPLDIPFFSTRKVQEIVPAIGNDVEASLVLTKPKKQGADNDVMHIYYIKHSYKDDNIRHYPPDVRGLVYHNLGEDKEFLGIKIYEPIYCSDGTESGMVSEVRLDDKSAQYLLDFRTDDTKWINKTDITFEITDSPKVMSPKIY